MYLSKIFEFLSLVYIFLSPEIQFQKQEVVCLLGNWSQCFAAMLSIPGIAGSGGQFLPFQSLNLFHFANQNV